VLGVADTDQIFTVDIQRRYTRGRQERRGVYYMCRAVSTKKVSDMKYEELKPVHIAFILTDYPDAPSGIRKVGLCYLDTGEIYDELIELVLVYVPAVVKDPQKAGISKDDDLYVFTRFFAVSSSEEATAYVAEFETNDLARELISVYNLMLADRQKLEEIENSPYFTQRLNEAQLAEARAEAELKGEAKVRRLNEAQLAEARAEAEAKGEAKVRRLNEAQLTEARAEAEAKGVGRLANLIKEGYDVDAAVKIIMGEHS
jgi:hypothetical protein